MISVGRMQGRASAAAAIRAVGLQSGGGGARRALLEPSRALNLPCAFPPSVGGTGRLGTGPALRTLFAQHTSSLSRARLCLKGQRFLSPTSRLVSSLLRLSNGGAKRGIGGWGGRRKLRWDGYEEGHEPNWAVWGFLALNTGVFGLWVVKVGERDVQPMLRNFTVSWQNMREGRYYTLLTAAISHVSPSHFLFNMLAIYVTSTALTRRLNQWQLVHLYVGGALSASLSSLALWSIMPTLQTPAAHKQRFYQKDQALGASGAVMSYVGALATILPNMSFLFFGVLPMTARSLAFLYVASDMISVYYSDNAVGSAGHLGGIVYGVLWGLRNRRRLPF